MLSSSTASNVGPNLDEEYERVLAQIDGFRVFVRRVIRTVAGPSWIGLYRPRIFRLVAKTLWQMVTLDILSEKAPAGRRDFYLEFTPAADRMSDYYAVVTSHYWNDALSALLMRACPDSDFEVLASMHELRKETLLKYSPEVVVGLFLSILGFLLKSVPKAVVETDFGLESAGFERSVFWFLAGVTGYLSLFLIKGWVAKGRFDYAGRILRYTALKAKQARRLAESTSVGRA